MDAVEDVRRRLDLIERTDPSILAWVTVDRTGALEAASNRAGDAGGPLDGAAVAIKDIIDVAGLPTRGGSLVLSDNVPDEDAPVVRTLRSAGAIVLGKTNTHEFAYGYVTSPTRNPWDPSRIPGGSSGGSAAAVAAGHVRIALGTDTGGSIRVPAALCGVCGLKPRRGIVPLEGIIPLSPRMDVAGPIGKRVQDVVELWEVMSGTTVDLQPKALRLGLPQPSTFGDDLEPAVMDAYQEAVRLLSKLTGPLIDIEVPNFEEFNLPRAAMVLPDALGVHHQRGWWPAKKDLYSEETRSYLEFMEAYMNEEMIAAGEQEAGRLVGRFLSAFEHVDVIVTPTAPCGAPTHEQAAEVEEGSPRRPIALKLGRLPSPANMADLPALSVPCGFTPDGLPIGLQLIGREEEHLLGLARAYELATDWHTMGPPL